MSELDVGTNVTCGICGRETKVQFITDREGGKAFDLDCMHRNAICPTCNALVRDDSDQVLRHHEAAQMRSSRRLLFCSRRRLTPPSTDVLG